MKYMKYITTYELCLLPILMFYSETRKSKLIFKQRRGIDVYHILSILFVGNASSVCEYYRRSFMAYVNSVSHVTVIIPPYTVVPFGFSPLHDSAPSPWRPVCVLRYYPFFRERHMFIIIFFFSKQFFNLPVFSASAFLLTNSFDTYSLIIIYINY